MADQWLSIIEYARRFKISDMTIRRRIKTGRLTAVLRDGKYYIPLAIESHDISAGDYNRADRQVANDDSSLVKSHPNPKTFSSSVYDSHRMSEANSGVSSEGATRVDSSNQTQFNFVTSGKYNTNAKVNLSEYSHLPENLWKSLLETQVSSVDSKALLAYCEATIRRASEAEIHVEERFKNKIESLEATVQAKDLEIKSLRQQLEDLQLLVKIIEKKK